MTNKHGVLVDVLLVLRCAECGLVVRGSDSAVGRARAVEQAAAGKKYGKGFGLVVLERSPRDRLEQSAAWVGRAQDRLDQLDSLADASAGYGFPFGCPWCEQDERNEQQLRLSLEVAK